MRKITGFLVGALFSILFISVTVAQEGVWVKGYPQEDSLYNPTFFTVVKKGYCGVGVRKDGSGVSLMGVDLDWRGKIVTHLMRIVLEVDGKITVNNSTREFVEVEDKSSIEKKEGGYQVFSEKCFPLAKKLPEDVKKFFWGYGGIE